MRQQCCLYGALWARLLAGGPSGLLTLSFAPFGRWGNGAPMGYPGRHKVLDFCNAGCLSYWMCLCWFSLKLNVCYPVMIIAILLLIIIKAGIGHEDNGGCLLFRTFAKTNVIVISLHILHILLAIFPHPPKWICQNQCHCHIQLLTYWQIVQKKRGWWWPLAWSTQYSLRLS